MTRRPPAGGRSSSPRAPATSRRSDPIGRRSYNRSTRSRRESQPRRREPARSADGAVARAACSSSRSKGSGRHGRCALTTDSATIVWRAQQANSYTLNGNHEGSSTISAGSEGTRSHDHSPNSASHRWVKTRAAAIPPCSRMNSAAIFMCSSEGSSPASRSAQYASIVVDRSPGPSKKFAHVPSARCWDLIQAALRSVSGAPRMPRNSRRSRSSASIVTLVCSSPRHQPASFWSESRCSRAASSASRASLWARAVNSGMLES